MTMTTNTNYATQRTSLVAAMGPSAEDRPDGDGGSTALLPEPGASGLCDGSLAQLSMLLTQADEQDRAASRQIETTADQAATREENERVAQLQTKARDDESQAVASGVAGIAGGAITVVGAFVGGPSASNAAGASSAGQSTDWHQVLSGVGAAAPKVGDLVAGQFKGDADNADASAARFDAEAQSDLRRYNEAHDDAQAANQSMQKVQQFLDQVQQTENATRLAAATLRG